MRLFEQQYGTGVVSDEHLSFQAYPVTGACHND